MSWGGDMAILHMEIGLFRHLKQTKKRGQFSLEEFILVSSLANQLKLHAAFESRNLSPNFQVLENSQE